MKDNNQWKQIGIFSVCLLFMGVFLGQVVWGENGWNNFWDVFGSIIGVLGTYLVMRREVESGNRQHDEQIKLEKIHYNGRVINEQLERIYDLNSNRRIVLCRKIRALDADSDEETMDEIQSELDAMVHELYRVVRNNVTIFPILYDDYTDKRSQALERAEKIGNELSYKSFKYSDSEGWMCKVLPLVTENSDLQIFLKESMTALTEEFDKMFE